MSAVQHGARSERLLQPLADEIERLARASEDWPPHLQGSTRYDSEVRSWAFAEATCERLREYVGQQDPVAMLTDLDETAEDVVVRERGSRRRSTTRRMQSGLEMLRRWEDVAGRRRAALGLTPAAGAKLARDLMLARRSSAGVDLAQLIAQATAEDHLRDEGELGVGHAPE